MAPVKPPVDLMAEVRAPDGAIKRWGSHSRAGDRPQGISFRTARFDGFKDASCTLSRRIDRDYVDLNLFDNFALIGADGSVAYDGRIAALPRSMDSTHHITVQAAGWMAHAKDRMTTQLFVDRDLNNWTTAAERERGAQRVAGYRVFDGSVQWSDYGDGNGAAISVPIADSWATGALPVAQMWYDAGPGNAIDGVYWEIVRSSNINRADANWNADVDLLNNENEYAATGNDYSGNLIPVAAANSGWLAASTADKRYALLQQWYAVAGGAAGGPEYVVLFRNVQVYGRGTGLTPVGGTTSPRGLLASDMISSLVATSCPKLNTAGVQATSYPIPHMVFRDPVTPYDAFLEINKFHLWGLEVWEDRTLHYGPPDLRDYDWQVRLADMGVEFELQGDSTESLANGIAVTFQALNTNKQTRLLPSDYAELRDDSPNNPANRADIDVWTELPLSVPTTVEAALQIGRAALAEYNQAKAPGTITARGHIRDRAGHWQPVWKVRAGQTIAIVDHPNDTPRLIVETDYTHGDGGSPPTLRISVDSTFKRLDAVLDRITTALTAANLA